MTGYSYDAQSAAIQRKRKLAEALLQTQGPATNQMAGGMVVKNSPLAVLSPLIQQQLGAKMDRSLDQSQTTLDADRNAKLGEWLKNMPGEDPVQPVMPSTGFSSPTRQATYESAQTASADAAQRDKMGWALQGTQYGPMGQAIGGSVLQTELSTPDIKYQDAGDRLLILRNGQQVGSIAKGVSPESTLSAETSRRGQDLSAATAVRGQDLTSNTARRGQDITLRGQDLTSDATRRGQDLSAETTRRGQDLKAQTGVGAKAPVLKSLEYTLGRFAEANTKVETGGPGGVKGTLSKVFDYEDATALDNLAQQISTELRTIFRIPGEGSLSDKEQAQYGLQLPSRNFSAEQNKQIMLDLENRARLRMDLEPLDSFDQQRRGGASGSWADDGWLITEE
jgi:hypothetical protein